MDNSLDGRETRGMGRGGRLSAVEYIACISVSESDRELNLGGFLGGYHGDLLASALDVRFVLFFFTSIPTASLGRIRTRDSYFFVVSNPGIISCHFSR